MDLFKRAKHLTRPSRFLGLGDTHKKAIEEQTNGMDAHNRAMEMLNRAKVVHNKATEVQNRAIKVVCNDIYLLSFVDSIRFF